MKKINKKLVKEAVTQYQTLNDSEYREKIRNAGKKDIQQKWKEYLAIMEFGLKIKPTPSINEQRQKMEMLIDYYEKIKQFESRRSMLGKSNR